MHKKATLWLATLFTLLVLAACNQVATPEALAPELDVTTTYDGSIKWEGHGKDSIQCPAEPSDGYIHWVLNQLGTSSDWVLIINGQHRYDPSHVTSGTVHFRTPYYDIDTLTAEVQFKGQLATGGNPRLVISDYCPRIRLKDLEVKKDAYATYERKIEWKLDKTVNGVKELYLEGRPGDSFDLTWVIAATKTVTERNFRVTGNITITNPNPVPVTVNVADRLDDGTVATVDCDPATAGNQNTSVVVPANGTLVCSYTASPTGRTATKNTATVTVVSYTPPRYAVGEIRGGTATATLTWRETVRGDDSVTLADPAFGLNEVISASATRTYRDTWVCPTDKTKYEGGEYCRELRNTATLTGPNTNLSASAYVKLICKYKDFEGCTPGFWRNWTGLGSQPNAWLRTGYSQSQSFSSAFGAGPSNITLLQAVSAGGGGEIAFRRHAVAALLNAAHPDVHYEYSTSQVISMVREAYATGNFAYYHNLFEAANERNCPLNMNLY